MTKRILRIGLLLVAVLLLLTGGLWYAYTHRPVPDPVQQTLFQGITYIRDVRSEPRPLVIHVVTVDLDAPGIGFLVTPGDPAQEMPLRALKTSQFLDEFDVQVAVNGDFFYPWRSSSPWDYYPHVGDPVDVKGFASSQGVIYSANGSGKKTLFLSRDNRAGFGEAPDEVFNAISGNWMLVEEGETVSLPVSDPYYTALHPRTAIALDREAQRLIIVVVDGRQPNYSEGVTLSELSQIIREFGGYTALNLDGGGSTTLVIEGVSGEPVVLNSPIDNRIPGRERPVANHLGVFAHAVAPNKKS